MRREGIAGRGSLEEKVPGKSVSLTSSRGGNLWVMRRRIQRGWSEESAEKKPFLAEREGREGAIL